MKTAIVALAVLPLAVWAQGAVVPVPVLKAALERGATITADNLTTAPFPAGEVYASTVGDAAQLVGLQAVRALPAGRPINRLHVRVAPAVARNQAVTLSYARGGVQLTGHGQALEDGALGQSIKVLNPATRATLVGTVRAAGVVGVN